MKHHRIGIDFDNTIVCYDPVFRQAAVAEGLFSQDTVPSTRPEIRERLRARPQGEQLWQKLQGLVYGPRMLRAKPFPGALDFIKQCAMRALPVFIVSHKTEFGHFDETRTKLRNQARQWASLHGFHASTGGPWPIQRMVFANTRDEKAEYIAELDCTIFIDDLEQTFTCPAFPKNATKILFNPFDHPTTMDTVVSLTSWQAISEHLFGC